jgi:hypothetical protein
MLVIKVSSATLLRCVPLLSSNEMLSVLSSKVDVWKVEMSDCLSDVCLAVFGIPCKNY